MSNSILVIGESGTGKSTAIRNLPPKETFILNIVDKSLPFRGSRSTYVAATKENPNGNYFCSDKFNTIMLVIKKINEERLDIKYLIIDDFGYAISNEFMRQAKIKGYDKYVDIGQSAFNILDYITSKLRHDLFCFVTMHTETNTNNVSKPKTVGKMIDQYVCIEGKFTYVLHALVTESGYKFITNFDGSHMAKTPMDLFPTPTIDNDFLVIAKAINDYNLGDVSQ